MGAPPSAAAASRTAATSSAEVPSGDEVPTTPGPMATIVDVGVGDVAGQGERGGHRHRLEVAAEGVAGGDGGVDQAGFGSWPSTRSEIASGSAAPSVMT